MPLVRETPGWGASAQCNGPSSTNSRGAKKRRQNRWLLQLNAVARRYSQTGYFWRQYRRADSAQDLSIHPSQSESVL